MYKFLLILSFILTSCARAESELVKFYMPTGDRPFSDEQEDKDADGLALHSCKQLGYNTASFEHAIGKCNISSTKSVCRVYYTYKCGGSK